MQGVDEIAAEIVRREGGYINDPDDPGGATNFGVTIHTMRALGLDLDRDGDIDVQDVKALTVTDAVDIFKIHYFRKPNIHLLPREIQPTVFDMQVNAGNNAGKILQRLVNEYHAGLKRPRIAVDGAIGPATARAVTQLYEQAGGNLVDAYGIARRDYYFAIADRRPASRKYARTRSGGKGGWIRRAEEFISPKYHMTAAEFQERTASWA